ncbi:hypothetical protein RFI_18420 [Reticulomyxa filosa]|uniref:Uncharacterized protein n=1 Tax=Reticulomyxa filosa TaxID=46433 RepID=X6MYW8_RETFI|nr:hypothetical protein RFI_18420 [Reticulomyxa filosa]|eukprot:ETO18823.1 hypothetical protein RFI_18420 [Reticulomyxa filosa]
MDANININVNANTNVNTNANVSLGIDSSGDSTSMMDQIESDFNDLIWSLPKQQDLKTAIRQLNANHLTGLPNRIAFRTWYEAEMKMRMSMHVNASNGDGDDEDDSDDNKNDNNNDNNNNNNNNNNNVQTIVAKKKEQFKNGHLA